MIAHVAIDLSLRSPAMAMWTHSTPDDPVTATFGQWLFVAFAQRQGDGTAVYRDPRIRIHTSIPDNTHADVVRYTYIVHTLLSDIQTECLRHGVSPENVHVFVEGYAFNAAGAGSSSKLHELGGCLLYVLHRAKFPPVQTLSPTRWRRFTTKRPGKTEALVFVADIVDLATAFAMECTTRVPNPIQDIADAVCMITASSITCTCCNTIVPAKKKRKSGTVP